MPSRFGRFTNNQYYHIFNKSIDNQKPLINKNSSSYFLRLVNYYRHTNVRLCYSQAVRLLPEYKQRYFDSLDLTHEYKVDILAYCLMPNHFHFLVKQKIDNGISSFMSNLLNGFTRYNNILIQRKGPIFLPSFRSKIILNEEALIHVSRYIHINPLVAGIISNVEDIWNYPLSSAFYYYKDLSNLINTKLILESSYFRGDKQKYIKFVENEAIHKITKSYVDHTEKWLR